MKKLSITIAVFVAAVLLTMIACHEQTVDTEHPLAPMVNSLCQIASNNQEFVAVCQDVYDATNRAAQIPLEKKSESVSARIKSANEKLAARVVECGEKLQGMTIPCVVDSGLDVTIPEPATFTTVDTDGMVAMIEIHAKPQSPATGPLWFQLLDGEGNEVARSAARPQSDGALMLCLILTTNNGPESLRKLAAATSLRLTNR